MDTACISSHLIMQAVGNTLGLLCFHSFTHTFIHPSIVPEHFLIPVLYLALRGMTSKRHSASPQGVHSLEMQRQEQKQTPLVHCDIEGQIRCWGNAEERHTSQPGDGCHGRLLGYETPKLIPGRQAKMNQFWGGKAFWAKEVMLEKYY